MGIIGKSTYQQFEYCAQRRILINRWNYVEHIIPEDILKEELNILTGLVEAYSPRTVIGVLTHLKQPMKPEIQDWTNAQLLPRVVITGVKKLGYVVSPDLFTQVSVEQGMDDATATLQAGYFDDENKAIQWGSN